MNSKKGELLGLHAGDGTLYYVGKTVVWELRGGLDEQEFYKNYVKNSLFEEFKIILDPRFRSGGKNGSFGFQTTNKVIISFLLKNDFFVGAKSKKVVIPRSVVQGSDDLKKGFLRGLFASDGTIYLTRINGQEKRTYPHIEVASISQQLIATTSIFLKHFGIPHYSWTYNSKKDPHPCYFLRIAGFKRCFLFEETIGFINPKHKKVFRTITKVLKTDHKS